MSGKTKRIIYYILSGVLLVLSIGGVIMMWYYSKTSAFLLLGVAFCYILFHFNILIHEAGHIVVGKICAMKFTSVRIGYFSIQKQGGKFAVRLCFSNNSAGECLFFPMYKRAIFVRYLLTLLGGAFFNIVYAAVFFVFYFTLPHHPALIFFACFAPVSLYEAIMALYPVELLSGKTDGATVIGLLKNKPEEQIVLRVLTVQSIIYRKRFSEIPKNLLFDAPVVRADFVAWQLLLILRVQYLLDRGDEENAKIELAHILSLKDDLNEEIIAEVQRYRAYFEGQAFKPTQSEFYGIQMLEKAIDEKCS